MCFKLWQCTDHDKIRMFLCMMTEHRPREASTIVASIKHVEVIEIMVELTNFRWSVGRTTKTHVIIA
jgi:hypothetical protein